MRGLAKLFEPIKKILQKPTNLSKNISQDKDMTFFLCGWCSSLPEVAVPTDLKIVDTPTLES